MERQEKGGSTYFFLALVTLAFLAAVLYLTFGANRTEQEGYTVQTERPAREEAEHGDFQTLDELLEVRGIGSAKLDAMRDEITTGGDAP